MKEPRVKGRKERRNKQQGQNKQVSKDVVTDLTLDEIPTAKEAPKKKGFSFVLCKRCSRRGHHRFDKVTGVECSRRYDVHNLMVLSDPAIRNQDNSRILRENEKDFPPEYFGNGDWNAFDDEKIKALKSNQAAIYEIAFIWNRNPVVVYLGMTNDVRERLQDHMHGIRLSKGNEYQRGSNIQEEFQDALKKGLFMVYRAAIQENDKQETNRNDNWPENISYC